MSLPVGRTRCKRPSPPSPPHRCSPSSIARWPSRARAIIEGTTDMAGKISHTSYGDAPLSTARNADPSGVVNEEGLEAHPGDHLIGRTVTINRPRQELYEFWRDLRNLPRFMENIRA